MLSKSMMAVAKAKKQDHISQPRFNYLNDFRQPLVARPVTLAGSGFERGWLVSSLSGGSTFFGVGHQGGEARVAVK